MKRNKIQQIFILLVFIVATVCIAVNCKKDNKIDVTGISLNKANITFNCYDDIEQLVATIVPSNATDQAVIWSSKDETIATVSDDGTVTSKSEGVTTVTVSTVDKAHEASCNVTVLKPSPDCIPVTNVKLDVTDTTLSVNQSFTLNFSIEPANVANKNVTWSSSNSLVATVSSAGVVIGRGSGDCRITVTTDNGGLTATCNVHVVIGATGVKLSHSDLNIILDRNNTLLTPLFIPLNATDTRVRWSSSNTNIADIDQFGQIQPKALGTTVITATTVAGGFKATCNVTVIANPYRKIKGFLKTDNNGNFKDDDGIVAIQSMGNIYNSTDFAHATAIGFNSVRFYISAKDFTSDAAYSWSTIDNGVSMAKTYNLPIVLCLMTKPVSAQVPENSPLFFTSQDVMDRHVAFWMAVANRYKNEPAIAAYELMNEPQINPVNNEGYPFTKTYASYQNHVQRIVDSIRTIDMNHNIIIEHPWLQGATEPNLGQYNSSPNDQRDTWRNVNGKFDYPDVIDPADNYAYTYHCYEPGRYVHQIPQDVQTQFNCTNTNGDQNRVYPSEAVAKYSEIDPETGKGWTMNVRFLEYVYRIPMDYIRNVKKVPAYVGEWGVMSCNFTPNASGVNRGGRQYVLNVVSVLSSNTLSWSYHPYYMNEFSPNVYPDWESAMREALGTK